MGWINKVRTEEERKSSVTGRHQNSIAGQTLSPSRPIVRFTQKYQLTFCHTTNILYDMRGGGRSPKTKHDKNHDLWTDTNDCIYVMSHLDKRKWEMTFSLQR